MVKKGAIVVKACERCKHWVVGDPVEKVNNAGLCNFFLRNTSTAPYWANDLARITISWEGTNCPTYFPIRGLKR